MYNIRTHILVSNVLDEMRGVYWEEGDTICQVQYNVAGLLSLPFFHS